MGGATTEPESIGSNIYVAASDTLVTSGVFSGVIATFPESASGTATGACTVPSCSSLAETSRAVCRKNSL
jgi:hypothetical protein